MRLILLIAIFTLFLENNLYALTNVQQSHQAELEDPCQFVIKGDFFQTALHGHLHTLPLSHGNERLPIEFYIDSGRMPEYLIESIHEVTSDWNTQAGFEVVTTKESSSNDRFDQKSFIYWTNQAENIPNPWALVSLIIETPSLVITPTLYLQFNRTDIVINNMHSNFNLLGQAEDSLNQLREIIEGFQRLGFEIPANYLQDFETFEEAGSTMVSFLRQVPTQRIREESIEVLELRRASLGPTHPQFDQMGQTIEALKYTPDRHVEINRNQMMAYTEATFNRSNFELITQRATYINHFKTVFTHQIGHALGLRDLHERDVDPTEQQMPVMWYNFHDRLDTNDPNLSKPLQVGPLALHALSCTYNLELLRQAQP